MFTVIVVLCAILPVFVAVSLIAARHFGKAKP